MLHLDEVQGAWAHHLQYCREHRAEWKLHRATFETKMWELGEPWGISASTVREKLQFLVEMNRLEPFITSLGSDLFVAMPRLTVETPGSLAKAGRPADMSGRAENLRTLGEDWLERTDVREVAIQAYRMALMYGAAAIRVGNCPEPDAPLDQLWLEAAPPWDVLWDRNASPASDTYPGTERYRAHAKLRLASEVEEIIGGPLPEDIHPIPLQDVAMDGLLPRVPGSDKSGAPWAGYVRLIEMYDLVEGDQAFYIVEGVQDAVSIRQVGEAKPSPWTLASGKPGVPILPVVLLHPPDKPLQGVAAARRIMQISQEQNLGSTIVINAARRDASRTLLTRPGTFTGEAVRKIKEGFDLEVVEIADQEGPLEGAVIPFPTPPLPSSIGSMFEILRSGWQDVQGTSDIQQGRQQRYVSAREAGLLAAYGERAISDLQAAMYKVLARGVELLYAALATRAENVSVLVNGERRAVTPEDLANRWHIGIADTGTTPASAEARLADFIALQPQLMTLASIASGRPGPDGQPPAPELVKMAQLQLDFLVRQKGFPEEMSWSALVQSAKPAGPSADELAAAIDAVPSVTAQRLPVPGLPAAGEG